MAILFHEPVGTSLTQAEWETTGIAELGQHFLGPTVAKGDLPYANASATTGVAISTLPIGATGAILTVSAGVPSWNTTLLGDYTFKTIAVTGSTTGTTSVATTSLLPNRNAIINGAMDIWQRGVGPLTSATVPLNSDDTFVSDRWILLSEGNDIVDVSQTAIDTDKDSPAYSMTLDVETANKQFGICQILELKNSKRLIGQTVSLSFKAKVSNTRSSGSLCAAVLSCVDTGKDDTVISDVVKTWNGGGAEPTWYDTAGSVWTREGTVGSFTQLQVG